jgi:hypothetical protein
MINNETDALVEICKTLQQLESDDERRRTIAAVICLHDDVSANAILAYWRKLNTKG